MATLLASKVARVRRHVGDHPDCAGFTDRDWRHLVHACDESPRRAIRTVKAGQAATFLAAYLAEDDAAVAEGEAHAAEVVAAAGRMKLADLAATLTA